MASPLVIPIIIVIVSALSGYLAYTLVVRDLLQRRAVTGALRRYNIKKTPSEIVREYHRMRGEAISDAEAGRLERTYRQNGPDEFLTMYDAIRDSERRS